MMNKINLLLILLIGFTFPAAAPPSDKQLELAPWPGLDTALVAGGFNDPVHITHAGDGSERLFVVEQPGRVKILNKNLIPSTFLDISARVNSAGNEEGLLSIAFPLDYGPSTPYFYLYYTRPDGDNVVSRFTTSANPDLADPGSEEVVLVLDHPDHTNHNGGQMAFGPDGYLYIGTGDGGGGGDLEGNAQNPNSLLGKILRIDVSPKTTLTAVGEHTLYLPLITNKGSLPPGGYHIPADNPFIAEPGYREEIWALGLRNPWRFSFDRLTGDLYIGDVGQSTSEEVNFQPAISLGGENYGWNIMEGLDCFGSNTCDQTGLVPPIFTYPTHTLGCAVTGGYVYRGNDYPSLGGIYFFGDYCSGIIWGLHQDGGSWENMQLIETGLSISTFGEDEAGELYLADRGSGNIYQLVSTTQGS